VDIRACCSDLGDGEKNWSEVTAHDMRRTWTTHTYWSLSGARAREVVIAWVAGMTFRPSLVTTSLSSEYIGKIPDSVAIDVMDEADFR
jgi:hypothetical protein